MVKIIGKDERAVKRTTCGQCASILEYTLKEVQARSYRDWDGTRDTSYTIQCPNCARSVQVKGH